MSETEQKGVRPLSLRHTAAAVARNYGDKGAVVVTYADGRVRIGAENLTPDELREALCTAIHYSYVFEKSDFEESEDLTS
jgi:hypothetical protein